MFVWVITLYTRVSFVLLHSRQSQYKDEFVSFNLSISTRALEDPILVFHSGFRTVCEKERTRKGHVRVLLQICCLNPVTILRLYTQNML